MRSTSIAWSEDCAGIQRKRLRWLTFALLWLAGCAAPGSYQTYTGPELSPARVAHVRVPQELDVLAIDGRDAQIPLLAQRHLVLAMRAGVHELQVRYRDVWDVDNIDDEVVRSKPMSVRFAVMAGGRYALALPRLPSLRDAQAYAHEPTVWVVDDATGHRLAAPVPHAAVATPAEPSPSRQAQPPALDLLRYWWGQADPQQRREFLDWLHGQSDD